MRTTVTPTLLALLVLAVPTTARAGLSLRCSYTVLSRDGTQILVMIGPSADPYWDRTPTAALPDGRVVDLRATFGKSGVYDARTLAPVWQVDWYELERHMRVSADLQHIVRMNIGAKQSGWALAFYQRGKVVRQYQCDELLTGLRDTRFLPFSTWDWHHRWYEDFDLTPDGTAVRVATARRRMHLYGERIDLGLEEHYTFDLATGTTLERRRSGAWRVWAYAALLLGAVIAPPAALRALWRRVKRWRPRRGFEIVAVTGMTPGIVAPADEVCCSEEIDGASGPDSLAGCPAGNRVG